MANVASSRFIFFSSAHTAGRGVVQCGPDGGQGLLVFGIHRGPREGPHGGKVPSRWKRQGYEPSSFPRFRIDASTAPSNCFFAFSLSTSLPRYEYGSSYSRVHVTWDPVFVGASSRRVVPDFRKPWVCRNAYTAFSRRSVTSVSDSTFIPPRLYTQ